MKKALKKLKAKRRSRIEERFYKEFPERKCWVEPEKQMATMHITRVQPVDCCISQQIFEDQVVVFRQAIKEDIARKIGIEMLGNGLIDIKYFHDPCLRMYRVVARASCIPVEKMLRTGFFDERG